MRKILDEIQDGQLRRGVDRREPRPAGSNFHALAGQGQGAPDREGRRASCAAMMPWISAGKQRVQDISGGMSLATSSRRS